MRHRVGGLVAAASLVIALASTTVQTTVPDATASPSAVGELLTVAHIDGRGYALPGSADAYALTYTSRDAHGATVPVRATAWIPTTRPPGGGYPVLSYAHGTSGIGDDCRFTTAFDRARSGYEDYLGPWLERGYVIVATEYAGIGGPGVHAYLDAQTAGANVLDAVRAVRSAGSRLGVDIGDRYATDGGSQGGHASLSAASMASSYAPELSLIGSVAVAPPVLIDRYLALLGPDIPYVPVPDYIAYLSYVLRGLKVSRPDVDVESYLTATGKRMFRAAETLCYRDLVPESEGISVGDVLAKPLNTGPLLAAVRTVQGVPVTGYTRPVLVHQGVVDVTAFAPLTEQFVADIRARGVDVELGRSLGGHQTGPEAERQSVAWVDALVLRGVPSAR